MGRMFDVFGTTIDHQKPLSGMRWRNIHQSPPSLANDQQNPRFLLLAIKAIDVLSIRTWRKKPVCLEELGVGKTVLPYRDDPHMVGHNKGVSMFWRHGERCREGHELYHDMKESGVLKNMVMMFGQMNEPPGARFRVGHAALTMAEYFRDDHTVMYYY